MMGTVKAMKAKKLARMADLCPICGKNRDLVGLRHLCRPVMFVDLAEKSVTKPVTKPVTKHKGGRQPVGKKAMTGAERVRRHRQQRKGR